MNQALKMIYIFMLCGTFLWSQTDTSSKASIITADGYTIAKNSEEGRRLYPYGDTLEPILGCACEEVKPGTGLEKSLRTFDSGDTVHLTVDLDLQQKIEKVLDRAKKAIQS